MGTRLKLDFTKKLEDLDGKTIRLGGTQEVVDVVNRAIADLPPEARAKAAENLNELFGKELTIGSACVMALLSPYDDEKKLGDSERIQRFELARRLNKATEQEFNTTERDLLKKLVGKKFTSNLIAPTIWEMLEGATRVTE